MSKVIYLSHIIDKSTPTYGNRNVFNIEKKSSISKGNVANDSFISTPVHIGTHIDMPYHFYENGQTIEDFDAEFWIFDQEDIIFLELKIENRVLIVKDELINKLEKIKNNSKLKTPCASHSFRENSKLLIVKTGICHKRDKREFWEKNYGFHPDIAYYLRENFSNIKIFGFDSISVSSWQDRRLGRKAHKAFLNPENPILLLEDMNLCKVNNSTKFNRVIVSPLKIAGSDGLPCTIFGEIDD